MNFLMHQFSPSRRRVAASLSASVIYTLICSGNICASESKLKYNEHVRPILSNNCFQCHGPDEKKREADLRLDTSDGAKRDLGGYAAIVPGQPDKSALLNRILSHDRDEVMPPPKSKKAPITQGEIDLLRRWISEGAPYEGHWAFQPLSKEPVPQLPQNGDAPPPHPVDAFVRAKLAPLGITPSPEADRLTLLRRVALDLTGLPPSWEECSAFLADTRPDAYERAVDHLLASPHYGERWGRHWLDQARYADSNGYAIDGARDMWPYRDWVIRSLNHDMPFDRFTVEQLAGDLLPGADKHQRIASAFHRNTMINQEGGSNPEQFRNESVVDRVNTTGAVWLGLTIGCAQCHSHKYDPVSHQEYFRLFAFFNSSTDVNSPGETLEVLPGELLGKPHPEVSPDIYEKAVQAVAEMKRLAPERQKVWEAKLKQNGQTDPWITARIETLTSSSGRDFAHEEDGFVRLSAGGKGKETLTIRLNSELQKVEAVRLRLAPQKDAKGKESAISLSEFELLIGGEKAPLVLALAEKEQAKNGPKAAIDGETNTAWTPDAGSAKNGIHEIWFLLPAAQSTQGKPVSVQLRQESGAPFQGQLQVALAEAVPLLPPSPQTPASLRGVARAESPGRSNAPERQTLQKTFALIDRDLAKAERELELLRKKAKPATLMVMKELAEPRPTLLHVRGDYLSPDTALGPLEAGTPAVLPALSRASGKPTRLDLARWLVRPDNPLTPRVTVNRVWMHYFGQGLVETENDFGMQGTPPSHPALLDWLASDFIEHGWSLKHLHRRIVTSATYKQSSKARPELADRDPRNLLLARQNRFRLDAEIIRDSALQASGLLNPALGGPPVHPPQPEGVYAFTQAAKPWPTSQGPDRYRRALYTQFYRSAQHPLTSTFDAPNFSTTCTRRLRSNTPLQALMVANDETFFELAQATAQLLWRELPDQSATRERERVSLAFRRLLSRSATDSEMDWSVRFLDKAREARANAVPDAAPSVEKPAFPIPAVSAKEAAAWTALARGLMNTDEFITRE